MSEFDSQTRAMIRRLAAMSEEDRRVVLDGLGPVACEKLAPLLAPIHDAAVLSLPLQALIDAVGRGERPKGLTTKAAAALRVAAQTNPPQPVASSRTAARTSRISDLLKRGG